MKKSKFLD